MESNALTVGFLVTILSVVLKILARIRMTYWWKRQKLAKACAYQVGSWSLENC